LAIAKDARLARRKLFVTISNEVVDSLVVDYARDHSITIGPGVVDLAALEEAFISRFGPPTWRGRQRGSFVTLDRITWIDVHCDRVVELALGETPWAPFVCASLERASSWQAKRELADAMK
jgi:hypothetical protein